ncbi:hypothetical protein TrLO_g1829 [Triparma laevis f. longispina]|uniref:Glutathione S-transferase n=1 Tax=Triparma laevis f. longispina TaxID=1714387 RepID=A0A9W7AAQ5_9STRA|nr:hypothetical protein TrLO_g1829 [Triparma laevis f. longispina]
MLKSPQGLQLFGGSVALGLAARAVVRSLSYSPPEVWKPKPALGQFAAINKPTAGPQKELALPRGKHDFQLYSMGTPNGVKVTILLEALCDEYSSFDYDAHLVMINGDQFGSEFVDINPNSKIPCALDFSTPTPTRLFESAAIMTYLCETYDKKKLYFPDDKRTEIMNWLFWIQGSAPFVGGGFGHFYNYAPYKIEYAIDRYTMETKRLLDVLNNRLGGKDKGIFAGGPFIVGETVTIADMAIWPWFGNLCLGRLYGGSDKFLNVEEYAHVCKWAKMMSELPSVARGRMVNRPWGKDEEQLHNRHSRADFETNTQDKLKTKAE